MGAAETNACEASPTPTRWQQSINICRNKYQMGERADGTTNCARSDEARTSWRSK